MAKPTSEKVKHQWVANIQHQRASGLSIERWCQTNNIRTHVFHYWKRKLFPKATIDRSAFVEIQSEKKATDSLNQAGIFIEFQGVRIHLDRHFDSSTLKQCLKVVKEIVC